jgi:hypothetical protein
MEHIGCQGYIGHLGDLERFAIIEGFQFGKLIQVLQDQVADAPDQFTPCRWAHCRPRARLEGPARRFHPVVNVHFVAFGDLCDDLTCGGIGDGKCLAGSSR